MFLSIFALVYLVIAAAIFVMAVGYDQITKKYPREILSVAMGSLAWFPLLIREIWREYHRKY
jgi:hypothetical protein